MRGLSTSYCFLPALCHLSHLPEQPAEGGELVARVQAAGVWQNPELRRADTLFLGAEPGLRLSKRNAEGLEAEYRDHTGTVAADLCLQSEAALFQLHAAQLRRRSRGLVYDVRDAIPVLQQFPFLERRELPLRETRLVQDRPETVSRPGEVVANSAGIETGVDPHEQNL